MKSYIDIEKQVNRILVTYLTDEYSQAVNTRAKQLIKRIRYIQKRYTFNINKHDGFCEGVTFEEQYNRDTLSAIPVGCLYEVYKDVRKRYGREVYAGY